MPTMSRLEQQIPSTSSRRLRLSSATRSHFHCRTTIIVDLQRIAFLTTSTRHHTYSAPSRTRHHHVPPPSRPRHHTYSAPHILGTTHTRRRIRPALATVAAIVIVASATSVHTR